MKADERHGRRSATSTARRALSPGKDVESRRQFVQKGSVHRSSDEGRPWGFLFDEVEEVQRLTRDKGENLSCQMLASVSYLQARTSSNPGI